MKQKKFKNTRLFKILRVILIIIIAIVLIKFVLSFFNKTNENITLIIGEEKVSLKNELLSDKDEVYISIDDVMNLYDSNIYYNQAEKMIITTHEKSVAKIIIGQTTMEVNSSEVALKGKAKEKEGIIYLPFLSLSVVYDFEYDYDKETKVLILDAMSKEKTEAVVVKNAEIKEGIGKFSKTLESIKRSAGEYVTVFGIDGDYTKVRTSRGNIGYIKSSKLSNSKKTRENLEIPGLKSVNILEDYSVVSASNEAISTDSNLTNIVMPNLFNIKENFEVESIIDLSGNTYSAYKNWVEENNLQVCATVTFSGSMSAMCSKYVTRTCVINILYNQFINNKINMICIDFNNVDDIEGLYRFIIELTPRFKESGLKVLAKYKEGLNKERLENIVDYVVP